MTGDAEARPTQGAGQLWHRIALAAFLVCAAVEAGSLLNVLPLQNFRWVEGWLLILALVTTLILLVRTLPLQNVVMATVVIMLMASVSEAIGAKTGIPFGRFFFTEQMGLQIIGVLPWPVPLIWAVFILNSRGVARLMLRPWRRTAGYGFWVIGVTTLLTLAMEISLEPFAVFVGHYRLWDVSAKVPMWHTAPLTVFLGWGLTTLLILAFVTPWLINKQPGAASPPDYQPLMVWSVLNLIMITGNARQQLWLAAGVGMVAGAVVVGFAVRGARGWYPQAKASAGQGAS